ncbi:glycosyltransferase 87 family protein [Mycobacterium sp. GA-2829]|uniref:glycosyltransferase 87 family protein n=1 Tax=Mycobacterium sp. GA-2829 TaxID=1772283 RepID=UPI00073FEAE4|nr:glycosyltransferase 87 family protein [Mycobacterium sp. GA-2829]KUI40153.1 alpha-(1-2)-phosphatidylinositol mannosyltransferase [Mycobacterium sp. GA-2829]
MSTRRSPAWAPTLAWRTFCLLTLAGFGWAGWRLLGHAPYRIDIDVYRMGGRAWLDGDPLYADGAMFATQGGLDLPFTYPPLAATVFSPFALMSLPAASVVITAITLLLLVVAVLIVLTRLDVWTPGRRVWLAAAIVAIAVIHFEPIEANFSFGQINVVLMTLVIADCVPRRTPWPRGVLLGVAIALKLTPAVFLLYFLLRRDTRALLVTAASAVTLTVLGFALSWRDSWEYWTETVRNTDRIGTATLNTNQNIAGTLARLGLGEDLRYLLWVAACFAVLAVTVWAATRALRADEPVLALVCVAVFGLVVSPVSWSHHWVWSLPVVVVSFVVAYRTRHVPLAVAGAVGCALMVWSPITLLPEHQETSAPLWRQLVGGSYVWWALLVLVAAGTLSARLTHRPDPAEPVQPAAASGSRAAG